MARPKATETSAQIAVRGGDGALRIAVVADTHSAPHRTAIERVASLAPDAILHAGDIGDLAVLDAFAAVAPLFAVRGNIDVRAPSVPDLRTLDVMDGESQLLRILLLHIAVDGARLRADAARLARSRDASLVVCGHSHVPLIARDGGISVFNPGSVGPRRFGLPIVFGTQARLHGCVRHVLVAVQELERAIRNRFTQRARRASLRVSRVDRPAPPRTRFDSRPPPVTLAREVIGTKLTCRCPAASPLRC